MLLFGVGFEVLTEVVINVAIFWDIAPCGPYMNRFGGTYHLHLQGRKSGRFCLAAAVVHPVALTLQAY
jgi:hypothetical protein